MRVLRAPIPPSERKTARDNFTRDAKSIAAVSVALGVMLGNVVESAVLGVVGGLGTFVGGIVLSGLSYLRNLRNARRNSRSARD